MAIKADIVSHMMNCGLQDMIAGKLDAKPMLCVGWIYFKEQVTMEQLQTEVLEKLVSKVGRYRGVPVERDGWTYFDLMPIEELDLQYHFSNAGSFETDEDFHKYLEHVVETGLDYSKPMWKYILIDRLPCGRAGVLGITDHTLGDGASQMSGLLSMCEKIGDNPVFQKKKKIAGKRNVRSLTTYERLSALATGITKPLLEAVQPADMETKLKVPSPKLFPSGWSFATTRPEDQMDLNMIKDIKNRVGTGCTVNDVMLALTALAIKQYYLDINDPIMKTNKDITATYAVNTRPAGVDYLADEWFGNHIVATTTTYPLHRSRVETLLEFRDASRIRKASPDSLVRKSVMKALQSALPRDVMVKAGVEATCKFSIMISNVLLSLDRIKVFGQEVDDVQFLAFAPLGCYCGVATYAGKVNCNVVVAKDCESDPTEILPYYKRELEKLHKEVMEHDSEHYVKQDQAKPMPLFWYILLLAIVVSIVLQYVELDHVSYVGNLSLGN